MADKSPAILRLNNLSHEIGDTVGVVEDAVYATEQLVMMAASGDIDLTVCDEKMAERPCIRKAAPFSVWGGR